MLLNKINKFVVFFSLVHIIGKRLCSKLMLLHMNYSALMMPLDISAPLRSHIFWVLNRELITLAFNASKQKEVLLITNEILKGSLMLVLFVYLSIHFIFSVVDFAT